MLYLSICLCHLLIAFITILSFSEYKSFVSLGLLLCISLFCCDGKWDYFLNLSDFSLLVYRTSRHFCGFGLYPTTLPTSLIVSSSFLQAPLEFFMYSVMSSASSDSFTSYFPIRIRFIYLSFFSFLWLDLPRIC